MKKLILFLLPVLALLSGCNRQNSVTYFGLEAGTVSAGVFTTDEGVKMTVVGNEDNFDVTTTRRVMVRYETHPITDFEKIDIDVLALMDAGIPVPTSVDVISEDPDGTALQVSDAWFSADYLNILATFSGKDPTLHTFSAVYKATEQGVTFRLSHDGTKDTASGTLSVFLSIPVYDPMLSYEQQYMASGMKQPWPATVVLQWTSTTLESGPLTVYERKGSYTPPVSD